MLIDVLLSGVYLMIDSFLNLLPDVVINFDSGVVQSFLSVISGILYFLPWRQVVPILGIIVAIQSLRISIALVKTILNLIPLF